MRALYFQDSHIKGVNPSSRKGDYYHDVMVKVDEVVALSKELNVDYVIHGGDLFDSSKVSNLIVDDFIDKIEKAKIHWYVVPGNHDEEGHNWKNSKGTALAHIFRRSKYIHYFEDTFQHCDCVKAFPYYHNIEADIKTNGLYCESNLDEPKIAFIHAMITLKPFHPDVLHVQAKDIATDFDVIVCAHYHEPWGIKEINGTRFVNIGCFGRTSISEADVHPSILLIDYKDTEIGLEIKKLKSAKTKDEVFDIARIEKAKGFNANIDNFINSLKDTKISGLDLMGIIENLAKEKNVERYIVDEVIERIGKYNEL